MRGGGAAGGPLSLARWFGGSLARHWDLLWQMVLTDLRGRVVGSSLGMVWTVIHPIVMITIYIVVFSEIMGAKLPHAEGRHAYGIYLCAGLLPWLSFQEIVMRLTTIFPDNAHLVRKVAFPKIILFGYVAVSSAITVGISLLAFLGVLAVTGYPLRPTLLLWVPCVAIQLAFGVGLGMIAGVMHVFFRDTAQLVSILFQLAFWATPIVYVESILPEWLRRLEAWNPLAVFLHIHRGLVLEGRLPDGRHLAAVLGVTVVTLCVAGVLYRRFRSDLLDEL